MTRVPRGVGPVVANVKFQTAQGTAHIEGDKLVANATECECVWRSPYLLAVYEDSSWTPISLDAKTQTVKMGTLIQQASDNAPPSAQGIERACEGKEARRWVGVLMDGTEGQVEVEFENTKIKGSVLSVDGVEQRQGTWLGPRAFVYRTGGGWHTTYVDVGSVWTGTIATEPKTEGDVKDASNVDAGQWRGILSDGSEPVVADVWIDLGNANIQGDTMISSSLGAGKGAWYSPNVFVFLLTNGNTVAMYVANEHPRLQERKEAVALFKSISVNNLPAFNALGTRAEKAKNVKKLV